MPVLFIALGVLMLATAIKGNYQQVAAQVDSDVTGSGGFFVWIGAIVLIGGVGRAARLEGTAKMLIGLIIVVYLVSQQGIFSKAAQAVSNARAPAPTPVQETGQASNIPQASVSPPPGASNGQSLGSAASSGLASMLGFNASGLVNTTGLGSLAATVFGAPAAKTSGN